MLPRRGMGCGAGSINLASRFMKGLFPLAAICGTRGETITVPTAAQRWREVLTDGCQGKAGGADVSKRMLNFRQENKRFGWNGEGVEYPDWVEECDIL